MMMLRISGRLGIIGGLLCLLTFAAGGVAAQETAACWSSYWLTGAAAGLPAKGVKAFAGGDAMIVGAGFAARLQGGKLAQTALPELPNVLGATSLQSVDGVAPNDIWAVGFVRIAAGNNNTSSRPVTLHWDGNAWTSVPGPTFANLTELYGVRALATDDVWAVGVEFDAPPNGRALIEHWDGQTWRLVAGLDALGDLGFSWFSGGLRSISGTADDLWAAGGSAVLHWNGALWSVAYKSNEFNNLHGIAAASPNDVWAVGTTFPATTGLITALVLHWDGRSWSGGPVLEPGNGSDLDAVAATGQGEFWAVGVHNTVGSNGQQLVIRRSENALNLVGVEQAASSRFNAVNIAADGNVALAGAGPVLVYYRASCGDPRTVPTGATFPETNRTLWGRFYQYWQEHGGLAQLGYPISEEFSEVSDLNKQAYRVQYFERAVLEFHPENVAPHDLLLAQLGRLQYDKKYPHGAPGQQSNEQGGQFFTPTGHRVGGEFWAYWQSHGGLAQQGYPISDEFSELSALDGRSYRVQYFERAVFEYHPQNQAAYQVLLSQLGLFTAREKYPYAFPSADSLSPLARTGGSR